MKKPVAKKRRGFDQGGAVDEVAAANLDRAYQRSAKSDEDTARYTASQSAQASAIANQAGMKTIGGKATLPSGRSVELGRADYPGFRKGGKVKKVMRARR